MWMPMGTTIWNSERPIATKALRSRHGRDALKSARTSWPAGWVCEYMASAPVAMAISTSGR